MKPNNRIGKKATQRMTKKPEGMRLNKMISHRSTFSRREADKLIVEGRVSVNDQVTTELATTVNEQDFITIDGKTLKPLDAPFTVIVYNKPRGELVTKSDPRGRNTVYASLPREFAHYISVGRLDYASEGVLLLTDSPKVATALMTSNLERIYNIKIDKGVTPAMISAMENGLEGVDATKGGHEKSSITTMDFSPFIGWQVLKDEGKYTKLRVAINEGKNRELRRFFAYFDASVLDLKRISFGGISLNSLPDKQWRYLDKHEYANLREFIKETTQKTKPKKEKKDEKPHRNNTTQNASRKPHKRDQ